MALPKLVTPEFEATIPSTNEQILFRPFLVKEEKILYMALESGEQKDIFRAINRILEECILTPGIDCEKFTTYDLEYLFLMLRSKSVGENIEISLMHADQSECHHSTKVMIRLEDIKVQKNDDHNNVIEFDNGIGLKLKDPRASVFAKLEQSDNDLDNILEMVYYCTESVFDSDTVYEEFTKEEMKEFIDNLSKSQFEKVIGFFNTMPKMKHDITYTCEACKKQETVTLEGLQSFFT